MATVEMKEIKPQESDSEAQKNNSWRGKLLYLLGIMTIEPMMFAQGLAGGITNIAKDQMILYKICRENQFNQSVEFCSNIEEHTNESIYTDIEKEVVSFNQIISITEHVVPILLSFYIGAWSDRFGRKPFLAVCMAGKLLGGVGMLLAGVYLEKMNRWMWLVVYMIPQNLSGGTLTYVMMTYSFIADNSSPRERMFRLGVLGFMWDLSYYIAIPLGAWLFSFGYVHVFGSSMVLYVIACSFGLARLWNFKEKINKSDMSFKDLLSPKNVTDSLKATFKKRPGKKHVYQQCMMLVMLVGMMGSMGESYCEFMYTKRLFQWKMERYSYFSMIRDSVVNCGTFIFMPIFHHFNLNDNIIILLASSSSILSKMVKAFARSETAFFASTAGGVFMYVSSAPIRAQMTRCVSVEELGKVFAMLASLESAVPILASAIFTNLYNATSELSYPWQGSFYFASSGFYLLASSLTLYVYISLGCKQIKSEEEEETERSYKKQSSNLHPDDMISKQSEIVCLALYRHGKYE